VSRIDAANIQNFHLAQVVCLFLSAANPANIIQSFRNAGISVVIAEDRLLCMVTPKTARCLLEREKVLTPMPLFDEEQFDDETDDDDEIDEDLLISLSEALFRTSKQYLQSRRFFFLVPFAPRGGSGAMRSARFDRGACERASQMTHPRVG
jgi:hypothetical protein